MRFRKIIALLLVALLLCACGKKETPNNQLTYTVKVVDETGAPVAGVTVQLCSDSCVLGTTDETGVATFQVAEADYKVGFVMTPEGYAADMMAYSFEAGTQDMTLTLTHNP